MDSSQPQTSQTIPAQIQLSSVAEPGKIMGKMERVGSVITVVLLLFFFPLGLLIMWFLTKWPKIVKISVTLFFLVIGGILAFVGLTVYRGLQTAKQNARNNPGYVQSNQNMQPKGIGIGNLQQGARNSQRRSDIESMAKVLEAHYHFVEQQTGMYLPPQPEWFAANKIPQDPAGGSYQGIPVTESAHFNICANLENVTPNQYCKQSLY